MLNDFLGNAYSVRFSSSSFFWFVGEGDGGGGVDLHYHFIFAENFKWMASLKLINIYENGAHLPLGHCRTMPNDEQ